MSELGQGNAVNDFERRRRTKNLALLAVLVALVVLFYVIALVRMGAWQ